MRLNKEDSGVRWRRQECSKIRRRSRDGVGLKLSTEMFITL